MAQSPLKVVAIADADSFVKWAAALLDSLPRAAAHLAIVHTPLSVSSSQEQAALDGTRFGDGDVTRVRHAALAGWLSRERPDVVVLAGRGPFVRLMMHEIDRVHPRPVVVAGLPGISIPAQRAAVSYRREADLFVVHSLREERAFGDLARRLGADMRFGLAQLPFATPRAPVRGGTDLVFAAQAIVPLAADDRRAIADILRAAAMARPDRRVVVKLRSRVGESETHDERVGYEWLLQDRPPNLVFSYQPMRTALASAEGLVTVSSTAAIEAVAAGVPVIALDTFGVSKENLNTVFRGSGLFGGADDVIGRAFRHPAPGWMTQNYFHDADEATWWNEVERLVAQRREGMLPPRMQPPRAGGVLRRAWDRKIVLGAYDRTLSGFAALAVGMPVRAAMLARRRMTRGRGPGSWADSWTDITVTPALRQERLLRRGVAVR